MGKFVLQYKDVRKEDRAIVGERAAIIGEIKHAGFPVLDGFIVTSSAYFYFLRENNIITQINHLLKTINFARSDSITQVAGHCRSIVKNAPVSENLVNEIFHAYIKLGAMKNAKVDLFSSATSQDIFETKLTSILNAYSQIEGESNLLLKIKSSWASFFSARALSQRHEQNIDHFRFGVAVAIQKNLIAENSGVIYTIDPITQDKKKLLIEAFFGQNHENIIPDRYIFDKTSSQITEKEIAARKKQKLNDRQIETLGVFGKKLEKHFFFPQKIVWEMGNKKIYIQYCHPLTPVIDFQKSGYGNHAFSDKKIIVKGNGINPGIATGAVRIITDAKSWLHVKSGEVIVGKNFPYLPHIWKKAAAIVLDKRDSTAMLKKHTHSPIVEGTENATSILKNGQIVSVNGTKGEIYKGGILQTAVNTARASTRTATKLFASINNPDQIEKASTIFSDGATIKADDILKLIGIHPKKIIHDEKSDWLSAEIANYLEKTCKAFSPEPVLFQLSDLTTTDYRQLVGGKDYEPIELNPQLGYKGAFRAINDPAVFELELGALKIARHKKNQKNIHVLLPTIRSISELIELKKTLTAFGLSRSSNFQLYMPIATPINLILLDQFIEIGIDGVGIKADNLSKLLLGIDRDNSEVSRYYDPQNPGILWAYEHIIKTCHRYKISTTFLTDVTPSAILLEKLVAWGITTIAVPQLEMEMIRKTIYNKEKKL